MAVIRVPAGVEQGEPVRYLSVCGLPCVGEGAAREEIRLVLELLGQWSMGAFMCTAWFDDEPARIDQHKGART